MWRYFLEQLGSGHSMRDGEDVVVAAATANSVVGLDAPLELDRERLGFSSTAFPPAAFLLVPRSIRSLAGLGGAASPEIPPPPLPPLRPLAPFLNLLCMGLMEASIIPPEPLPEEPLVGTGVEVAPRPRLARPLGARDSASLVGESQNLK